MRAFVVVAAFSFPFFFSSASFAASLSPDGERVVLRDWTISAGEDGVGKDLAQWTPTTLPVDWSPQRLTGTVWLRTVVDVPWMNEAGGAERWARLQPGVAVEAAGDAFEILAGGIVVGAHGKAPPELALRYARPRSFPLPVEAVHDGKVVLLLKVWRSPDLALFGPSGFGTDGVSGDVVLGRHAELAAAMDAKHLAHEHGQTPIGPLGAILVFVGLYHLQLFRRRRQLKEYLWLGLLLLCIGLICSIHTWWWDAVTTDELLRIKISLAAGFLICILFIRFLWPFLGVPLTRFWRIYLGVQVAGGVLTMLVPGVWFMCATILPRSASWLPWLIMAPVVVVRAAWKGQGEAKTEARTIVLGMVLCFFIITRVVLQNFGVVEKQGLDSALLSFTAGMTVFMLAMVVSLSNRFMRVYNSVDELNKTLEQKNRELLRMDKLKDDFLANTSHELRTPLNGIIGIADSLLDGAGGALSDVTQKNLKLVLRSGKRLATLVDDILDFSKMKNRELALHKRALNISAAVDTVVALSRPQAQKKKLELVSTVDTDFPPVLADEDRLTQILTNLVGNALKFTAQGRVEVSARLDGDRLAVTVSDTGIGIAEDALQRVFVAFEQADSSTSRTYGGTGLGLSVTKELVELHGGTISVESKPGAGSRFTFTVPLAPKDLVAEAASDFEREVSGPTRLARLRTVHEEEAEVVAAAPPAPSSSSSSSSSSDDALHVLVVDDEDINLAVFENHLLRAGYRVTKAASGQEALALLQSGVRPDLVLLDVMMPGMTGYAVSQELRARFTPAELPVVLVTAKNQLKDLVDGFSAGANDFLTKPITKDELLTRLRTHLAVARMNVASGRFVPREFLRILGRENLVEVRRGDHLQKEMSILFSDIRSFTTIVEGNTPEQNFRFINDYLGRMEPPIQEEGGFIDSYIGDAIMALFDDHKQHSADHAVRAGLGDLRALESHNADRAKKGEKPLKVGIGINTGLITLGTIGGKNRINCGVIGDSVNLAARVESMTKMYGAAMLISEFTHNRLVRPADYQLRVVDRVRVKGKTKPVTVYEVLDALPAAARERRVQGRASFAEGWQLFQQKDVDGALDRFTRAQAEGGEDDEAARLWISRCHAAKAEGLPADFDGVVELKTK